MIIVSQDKETIEEFKYLYIESTDNNRYMIFSEKNLLGIYSTKAQAKEVLSKVVDVSYHCNNFYEMPPDKGESKDESGQL